MQTADALAEPQAPKEEEKKEEVKKEEKKKAAPAKKPAGAKKKAPAKKKWQGRMSNFTEALLILPILYLNRDRFL